MINLEDAEDEIEDIQVSSTFFLQTSETDQTFFEQSEISILSSLDSPFVTKYEGSWLRGQELWIVMEYLSGGSCGDLLKPGVFKEEYIAIICRELLKGLEYLHGEGKLHRDIKGMLLIPYLLRVVSAIVDNFLTSIQLRTSSSALLEKVRRVLAFSSRHVADHNPLPSQSNSQTLAFRVSFQLQ